ncbi:MAG: hypothetical protein WCO61_04635 [Alphaproteobacteria bacterium]
MHAQNCASRVKNTHADGDDSDFERINFDLSLDKWRGLVLPLAQFFRAELSRMLFDHCAVCRQCCTIEEGYPPLEITLTAREEKRYGSLCVETNCTNLGPQGCTLGDEKPFSCSLYPLSYDPESDRFSFDRDCPLKETYFAQLDDPESDASRHLSEMSGQIEKLKKTDPKFLFTNRSVDVDYFDLQELPSYKRQGKTR